MEDLSHKDLKEWGNRYLESGKLQRAISCYSNAIKKQGSISIYFSNRALCYLKTGEFDKCISDCKQSADLDPMNIKAYFYMGQAYLEQGNYDEALMRLVRAHEMSIEQHKNFGDDITSSIRLVKRLKFEKSEIKRSKEDLEFKEYLENLIRRDFKKHNEMIIEKSAKTDCKKDQITPSSNVQTTIPEINATFSTIDSLKHLGDTDVANNKNDNDDDDNNNLEKVDINDIDVKKTNEIYDIGAEMDEKWELDCQKRLQHLNEIFKRITSTHSYRQREIPDYLCGRISFEIMRDPVIAPSGITYDRQSIVEHLHRVGHFDPITRQSLNEDQLISNVVMKEVVNTFLDDHPWARYTTPY